MQNEEVQQVEAETEGIKPVVTLLPCTANICYVHISVYIHIHTKIDIYKTSLVNRTAKVTTAVSLLHFSQHTH